MADIVDVSIILFIKQSGLGWLYRAMHLNPVLDIAHGKTTI